jgi:hypothetical protein
MPSWWAAEAVGARKDVAVRSLLILSSAMALLVLFFVARIPFGF